MAIRLMKNNMVWYYIEIDKTSVGALRYGNYTTARIIVMPWPLQNMHFPNANGLKVCSSLSRRIWPWVTRRRSYKNQEILSFTRTIVSPPYFGGFLVVHLSGFLCYVFANALCLVSNVARVSGLFIHWFPLTFSWTII